jgi:type IV pilus assembly protein PilE
MSGFKRSKGFTLIEMMVTVLVVAILASIAVPSYTNQVRKSRRTDARSALLDAAAREERFFATNNYYSTTATDLGYSAWQIPVGGGWYELNATCDLDTNNHCTDYTLTATPQGTQVKDATCASFQVTQTGQQTATGAVTPGSTNPAPDTTTSCWN